MREIFKSKLMLLFILFIMGVCYLNSVTLNEVNMKEQTSSDSLVFNEK